VGNESYLEGDAKSHPYIEEGDANDFREMWRLIRELLEAKCTVQGVERRDLVLWHTLLQACSLRTPPLWSKGFDQNVVIGLAFWPGQNKKVK
jgi:hypothetical protein